MKLNELWQRWQYRVAGALFIAASLWVLQRVQGVLPLVMQDEYIYSMQARKIPFEEHDHPNYLHSLIYSTSDLCGIAYYNCAKTYNWVFFLGYVAMVFFVARRFLTFWPAFAISIATLISPLSTYVSLFTPESMFFFISLGALVALWRSVVSEKTGLIVASGAILGLAALVKPHALFLIPAALAAILLSQLPIRSKIMAVAGYPLSALLLKSLIGLTLAGPSGLSLFGSSYSNALWDFINRIFSFATPLSAGATTLEGAPATATLVGSIFLGQFLWLAAAILLISAGLVIPLVAGLRTTNLDGTELTALTRIVLFSIGSMVITVSMFAVLVTLGGDDHTGRVLLRYLEFLFPLVFVVAVSWLAKSIESSVWLRAVSIALVLTGVVWFSTGQGSMTWLFIDSPWLKAISESALALGAVTLVAVASLSVMSMGQQWASRVLVPLFGISYALTGLISLNQLTSQAMTIGPNDAAGIVAREYLSSVPADKILLVGPERPKLLATAFLVDKPGIEYMVLQPFEALTPDLVPNGIEWVIALRSTAVDLDSRFMISGNAWAIFNVSDETNHSFTQSMSGTIVEATSGLSAPSQMGQRMNGESAVLDLVSLPKGQVTIQLEFLVGPSGGGAELSLKVGNVSKANVLPPAGQIVRASLEFISSGEDQLIIRVPETGSNAISLISLSIVE